MTDTFALKASLKPRFVRTVPWLALFAALAFGSMPFSGRRAIIAFLFLSPVVIVICLGLLAWIILDSNTYRRLVALLSLGIIVCVIPITFVLFKSYEDKIRFMFWYPFHRGLVREAKEDGIIADWALDRAQGFTPPLVNSYLVHEAADSINSNARATGWVHRFGSDCEIEDVQRMMKGIYIITTVQCELRENHSKPKALRKG